MVLRCAGLVIGCGLLLSLDPVAIRADDGVQKIVREELERPIDRRAELKPLLLKDPEDAMAHWQAGFVQQGEKWQPFEAPVDADQQKVLDDYRARRDEAKSGLRGQLSLATWCRQQGLKDQARAHYLAALGLAGNDDERRHIYPRLGYRRLGALLLSPQEIAEWRQATEDADAARKKWGSKIEKIARTFGSPNLKQRAKARSDLAQITDPMAASLIEQILGRRDFESADAAVTALAAIPAHQATLVLAQMAIFSEWSKARELAIAALRQRKPEDFVPALIELLGTPIASQFGIVQEPQRGILFYTYAWAQETNNRIDVRSASALNFLVDDALDGDVVVSPAIDRETVQRRQADVQRAINDEVNAQERIRRERNQRIEEMNGRVAEVLSAVSGQPRTTDAKRWWAWWAVYGDVRRKGAKPVVEIDQFAIIGDPDIGQRTFAPPPAQGPRPAGTAGTTPPPHGAHGSCFQAGTLVWTESGPIAIERIRVGDRVLSQNSETGELAYKPVLQTSLSPARQMIQVKAGIDAINCTDGHRFWVPGEAWTKARELRPKDRLHTATGAIPVESVSEGALAETHNLVVADFHSYFVGKQALLVQDLPLPRSTNSVVPGFQPEF
jgi:hypothetical protein